MEIEQQPVAPVPVAASDETETLIEPARGWVALNLRDLWQYRELLYFLIWRDIKVRYKQTALGAAWAILQPLATMLAFTLFLSGLVRDTGGVPYSLWAFVALVPWTFFATGLAQSSDSLIGSANLIKKVYFPRLAIPIATVCSGVVDLALSFVVLLGLMAYYRHAPTLNIVFLPLLLLLALVTALGVGLWLSALNVQFRDVRYVVPFLTQFWLFATPVAYSSSAVPAPWRTLLALNPMVGVVEGFRWALLGTAQPSATLLVSSVAALIVLVSGAYYFKRMERSFADVV